MARPRTRHRKHKRPPPSRRTKAAAGPRPTHAERRLLGLAREIARLPLGAALEKLTAAWAPSAPLPEEVSRAWLKSRGDKTAALALAWAREQVRLSLQEIVEATPKNTRGRIDAAPDTLAWILLAACEALAHEPASAVLERVSAILQLTGHAGASG